MKIALLAVASYLLGALPTSYLVGRLQRGIDLREYGSGNLGATNAYRVLGWKGAVPTFAFDIFKGWLPAYLFPRLDAAPAWEWALLYGALAILGHVYSVYVGFKGGKGVATSAGVFLALAPIALLAGLVVWGAVVLSTRIVSVASIAAAVTLPVAVLLSRGSGPVLWLAVALAVFVVFSHRSNLRRLAHGEERRFGRTPKEVP